MQPVVVVVGMHRSGTSLCAHVLSALGIDIADEPSSRGIPEPDNPKGHWERWEIVGFHDRILGQLGRGYYTPYHDLPFPVAWWADPRVIKVRNEIIGFLQKKMGDVHFGFKDPRTVRLMPMWDQIFTHLRVEPKFVFCLRNPAQVARSLNQRDKLDLSWGEYRWLTYVADFFFHVGDSRLSVIEYEDWFNPEANNLEKLCRFLEIPEARVSPSLRFGISGIVDQNLRHDDVRREAEQSLSRSVYLLAQQADVNDAARRQLTSLASSFMRFREVERPLYRAFEGLEQVTLSASHEEPATRSETPIYADFIDSGAVIADQVELSASADEKVDFERRITELERERDQLRLELATSRTRSDSLHAASTDRGDTSGNPVKAGERHGALLDAEAEIHSLRLQLIGGEGAREALAAALRDREAALAEAKADLQSTREAMAAIEAGCRALQATLVENDAELMAMQTKLELRSGAQN